MAGTAREAADFSTAAAMARYERRLRNMSRTVLLADNRRAALTMIAARACESAEGDLGAVFVRDSDGDDVIVTAANRWSGTSFNPSATLVADLLANLELRPMLLDLSASPHAHGVPRAYRQLGPAMVARVGPTRHSRGALLIAKRASARHFTESDLRMLPPFVAEAGLAMAFAEARRELERVLLARDRSRIARELHDGVIQSLFGIGMVLEGLKGGGSENGVQHQLSGITASINAIIDDLRAYIHDLTPTRLAKRGLGSELCSLAQEFQAGSGVIASVRLQDGIEEIKEALARDLVQISREALSNVAKHAAASRVVISLECTSAGVRLEIADDGQGIASRKRAGGRGLRNIQRRAEVWGGSAEAGASGKGGTAVCVWVPGRGAKQTNFGASIAGLGGQLVSALALGVPAAALGAAG